VPNTLEDLRTHLFETLKALRDPNQPMSIDRAKAISDVAQTVINSAKVEVDYVRALGRDDLKLPVLGVMDPELEPPKLPAGVTGIHTHKAR